VLLGPTAEDIEDKTATCTTDQGLASLQAKVVDILPSLLDEEVTATYSGLSTATGQRDYQIQAFPEKRYIRVAGIRSTGLTPSMAIAEHVVGLLQQTQPELRPKTRSSTIRMPMIGDSCVRPYQDPDAISRNPDYGRIVCHCEKVTLGEIVDAC